LHRRITMNLNNPTKRKSAKPRLYLRYARSRVNNRKVRYCRSKVRGSTTRNSQYAYILDIIRVLRFLEDYQTWLTRVEIQLADSRASFLRCRTIGAWYFLRSNCFPLAKQTSLEDTRDISSTCFASSIPLLVLIFVSAQVRTDMTKLANKLASCVLAVRLNDRTTI